MRLHSTKESVAQGEVSLLAIAETLLAVALVFYLSAHFNTLRWLAVAMCISPLLLLRTERSTRLGILWFDRYWEKYVDKAGENASAALGKLKSRPDGPKGWAVVIAVALGRFLTASFFSALGVITPPVLRFSATAAGLLLEPLNSIRAIPKNWSRVALIMDTFFPPELMPDHPTSTLSKEMDLMSRGEYGLRRAFTRVSAFCILFLPALIYRWSLKATSVIYAPLVFIVHTTFRNVRDLRKKLELLKRSDVARIRVAYGIIFIAAFTVKIALMNKLSHFADWWNGHPITELLALYIAPGEIPKWQLASLINSFLALIAMFFVRAALTHIEVGCPWPELAVNRVLGFITAVRWPLAIYTILSMAYITMQAARGWKWPMLGTKWFPW